MMGRTVPKVLLAAGVISCLAVPASGGQEDPGFYTNLGLLSQLTEEAVSALADSLEVQPGEKITVVSVVYNEGNDFVADAFARELARRGVEVRLATESSPAPQAQAPAETPRPPAMNAGETGADTTGAPVDSMAAPADSTLEQPSSVPGERADSLAAQPPPTEAKGDAAAGEEAKKEREKEIAEGEAQKKESEEAAAGGEAGSTEVVGEAPATTAPAPLPPTVRPYPEGIVIEYRILEFGVNYPALKRRFLIFGDASVRRLGGVYLEASRIQGPEGIIKRASKAQRHHEDHLSSRARVRAEGATYPFTKPVIPPANVGKYFEPVAVAGIVTSLVYLFYQNQN